MFPPPSGNVDVAAELLECGAEADAIDERNGTPLHYACLKGHADLVRLLLKHGASMDMIVCVVSRVVFSRIVFGI